MHVLITDVETFEFQWHDTPKEVIMIAANVNHFGSVLLHLLENDPEEMRVFIFPLSSAAQMSRIDYVAPQDKFFTFGAQDALEAIDTVAHPLT